MTIIYELHSINPYIYITFFNGRPVRMKETLYINTGVSLTGHFFYKRKIKF